MIRKKIAASWVITLLLSCWQDPAIGAQEHDADLAKFNPVEFINVVYDSSDGRKSINLRSIGEIFPEFFVDNYGFQRIVKGVAWDVSDQDVRAVEEDIGAYRKIRIESGRSSGILVIILPHPEEISVSMKGVVEAVEYKNPSCGVVSIKFLNAIIDNVIWIRSSQSVSLLQPAVYSCFSRALQSAYSLKKQQEIRKYFGDGTVPSDRGNGCEIISTDQVAGRSRPSSSGCRARVPHFVDMWAMLAEDARRLNCRESSSLLCEQPLNQYLLSDDGKSRAQNLQQRWMSKSPA